MDTTALPTESPDAATVDATVQLELDVPQPGTVLSADESLLGYGWALADTPVRAVSVELDGINLGEAVIGLARTDIAELFPDHPHSTRAGLTFMAALPPRGPGAAELRLTVRTDAGRRSFIVPVEITGAADAPPPPPPPKTAAVPPPADLEPIRLALEEARIDPAGVLLVRGWAVAARQVRSVEVYFGQRSLGFADTALSRADVAGAFPAYPGAALAGFALQMVLPSHEVGAETVTAVVTDGAGETLSASRQASGQFLPEAGKPPPPAPKLAPMQATLEETRINELGVLRVRGWVVSLAQIEQVRVFAGDRQIGLAAHGLPRDDVAQVHPDYPNAPMSGFLLQLDVPDEKLVGQVLRVVVQALGGIHREVTGPVTAAPVIRRRPRQTADIHFHCDAVSLSEDGAFFLKGWAVCPSGTASIEVELGDEPLGNAELGAERADVGNRFPLVPGARNAGFRFVGRAAGTRAGEHVARVILRGRDGESRIVLLPVLALPVTAAPASVPGRGSQTGGIRYFLDTPGIEDGHVVETVRGFLSINGWAFSPAGLTGIEVIVDGRSQGQAYRGIRREDLHKSFGEKEALRSGFAMLVPPQVLKQGRHDVRLLLRDTAGHVEEVSFTLDAAPSMDGPGPWSPRQKIAQGEADLGRSLLAAARFAPHWTLLLPPEGRDAAQLRRLRATFDSLRFQVFGDWVAVLPVADNAARTALLADLADLVAEYGPRLRVTVAGAETKLVDLLPAASGPKLVALLSPGDVLGEDALSELSLAAATAEPPDFLYSDERRTDPADGAARAFFKPDWSPDLLLSSNYIGRLWAATPDQLARTGVTLGDLARHGDYDTVLRLTEQAALIGQVAKVLCARGGRTLDAPAAERRALQRALTRRGIAAEIKPGVLSGTWRVLRARAVDPLVSIVIPTIAARGLIRSAIASIREKSTYRNFEILCLDNIRQGDSAEGDGWKAWLRDNADCVVEVGERFNWSRFNNIGAREARGDVLLFLNDDVEVIDGDWLEGLLEHALRPEVGAVGPQLLYPDGKVQHAGMFLSRTVGRHAFRFSPRDEPGPFGLALTQRNVISVTGACLMVRRDVFEALGGFDEEHPIITNDLDFCLRARAAGRLVVYTPHVALTHHEMVSRGEIKDSYNNARFDGAWAELFLLGDPYFNPNLSIDYDDYVPEEEPVRALSIGHPIIAAERVRRVLAVKVDHIGDFISAFPAFRRLKQKFPNAELTVLAAQASVALAKLEPAIDRVIQFDFFHVRSEKGRRAVGKKDFAALAEQLAPFRFDLAIDLRRQPDTRPILQHTGARWLAGFDTANRTEWLDIGVEWEGDVVRSHKRTHISEALVQFVDAVAVMCESERAIMHGAPARAASRKALAKLAGLGRQAALRPLVCVHTGAGAENKEWPLASFAALLDLLVARHDVQVIVIGAPDEAATVERLLALTASRDRIASLVGRVALDKLPSVLAGCDLYVGNDSGPKHMAAALGVPTVGVQAGSVDAVEWGPLGPGSVAVRRAMTCSPCYLAKAADCHRALGCLTGVRVADVYEQCRRLLLLAGSGGGAAIALAAAPP